MEHSFTDSLPKPSLGSKKVFIPATLRVADEDKPVTIQQNADGSYFVPVKDNLDRAPKYYLKFRKAEIKSALDKLIGKPDQLINCKCYALSKDGTTGYCRFGI